MNKMVFLLGFIPLVSSLCNDGEFALFMNGERMPDTPAHCLRLQEDESDNKVKTGLLEVLHSMDLISSKDVETASIYSGAGLPVTSGFVAGEAYYVLQKDMLWVWPSVDYGHKVSFEMDDVEPGQGQAEKVEIETLKFSPRIFFIHNLLGKEEADFILNEVKDKMQVSTVGSVKPQVDSGRTSENTWLRNETIIKRVYKVLRLPYSPGSVDGLQVVRYGPGKFYNEHQDYLEPSNASPDNSMVHATGGTNRFATVFFYLNDDLEGGQTGFSKADPLTDDQLSKISPELVPALSSHKLGFNKSHFESVLGRTYGKETRMIDICHNKFSVRPKRLGAVLFYNMKPSLEFDGMTLHSGCPVIDGIKYGANLWVWSGNKAGKGIPAQMKVTFFNRRPDRKTLTVQWLDTKTNQKTMLNERFYAGAKSEHDTYHRHVFVFELDGEEVDRFEMNFNRGIDQHVNLPTTSEQPFPQQPAVSFINKSGRPLCMYWVPPSGDATWLNMMQAGETVPQNSYHAHVFEFREGSSKEDCAGRPVFHTHTVDGHAGQEQTIRVNGLGKRQMHEEL